VGDAKQPRGERPAAAKAVELGQRGDEHLARDILGRRSIADPQTDVAEHLIEVAVIQSDERRGVALRSRDMRDVRIQRGPAGEDRGPSD